MAANNYFNVTVGTTAVQITASGEGVVALANNGSAAIYIGFDANVTTSNGFPLAAGAFMSITSAGQQPVYAISTAGQDVRVLLGSL